MIHLNSTIKKPIDDKHYRTLYRCTCDDCGADRGYLTKQNAQKYRLCRKCCHKNISEDTRRKMSEAGKVRIPWNKGKTGVSETTREKMRSKKVGTQPANKGQKQSLEAKIKLSCAIRGISVSHFDDFTTKESKRIRNSFSEQGLHIQCFEKYQYRCDRCGIGKVQLNAHHLNSWKHFPEQRFDLDNLVSLCTFCHKKFHSLYGNGKSAANTVEQYQEYKKTYVTPDNKKRVIIVAGASGAGKSWVCNQLREKISYVEYDKNKHSELRSIIWNTPGSVLFDPYSHVSTFIKRNGDLFDVELYVIVESEEVVKSRLETRGGAFTLSVKKRIARMKNLAKNAVFSGTSSEVLKKLQKTIS